MSGAATSRRRRRGLVGLVVAGVVVASLAGCEYGEASGVSDVTDISARLHGTVHSTDPLPEYWFEYDSAPEVVEGVGLVFDSSTPHGEWACCGPMETASDVATGLTPDTTYQYRFCIRTEDGRGQCGGAASFRTKPDDRDVVSGSISVPIVPELGSYVGVSASVRAEPDGSDPVGRVSRVPGTYYFRYPDSGDATCLRILGNRVAIGFVGEYQEVAGQPDIPQVVFIEDNGVGGDRFGHQILDSAPLDCPDPSTTPVTWTTAVQGDITLTDH